MLHAPIAYDHVGLRVTDRERALAFYARLGFEIDPLYSNERVAEIATASGVRMNLIFNGIARQGNILMDEPVKWAAYTHAAFVIASMRGMLDWAERNGVQITEGAVDWGRRVTCFIRDPDGNVLEFNELKLQTKETCDGA